jgi:hypothetical protein
MLSNNKAGSGSAASYSKVPGSNMKMAAAMVVGGASGVPKGLNKPPVINGRTGPNTRSNIAANNRKPSREGAAGSDDKVMSGSNYLSDYKGAQREGSAKRRAGASAAAYHAENLGLNSNAMGPTNKNIVGNR